MKKKKSGTDACVNTFIYGISNSSGLLAQEKDKKTDTLSPTAARKKLQGLKPPSGVKVSTSRGKLQKKVVEPVSQV